MGIVPKIKELIQKINDYIQKIVHDGTHYVEEGLDNFWSKLIRYCLELGDRYIGDFSYLPNFIYFAFHLIFLPFLMYFNFIQIMVTPFLHWVRAKRKIAKVRVAEEHFKHLLGYKFSHNYLDMEFPELPLETVRVHYIDVSGDKDSEDTVLLLHGSHTWSYLYRKMIAQFRGDGFRVIALDFIGSGMSDKLTCADNYSYGFHLQTAINLIEHLKLTNIHVVGFDWGSAIAMSLAMKYPDDVAGVFLMRSKLLTGLLNDGDGADGIDVNLYRRCLNLLPTLNWRLVTHLLGIHFPMDLYFLLNEQVSLRKSILKGYNAPFPSNKFKKSLVQWPMLLPFFDDDAIVPEMVEIVEKLRSDWDIPLVSVESLMDKRVENECWRLFKIKPNTILLRVVKPTNFLPESHGHDLAMYMGEMIQSKYQFVRNSRVANVMMGSVTVEENGTIILEDNPIKMDRFKVPSPEQEAINREHAEMVKDQPYVNLDKTPPIVLSH